MSPGKHHRTQPNSGKFKRVNTTQTDVSRKGGNGRFILPVLVPAIVLQMLYIVLNSLDTNSKNEHISAE